MSQTLRRELKQAITTVINQRAIAEYCPELIIDELVNAALSVSGISKRGIDFTRAGLEWAIVAGEVVTEEQIARLQSEQSLLDEYERAMGYNPLPWTSPKLDKLRQFLITKSAEEIQTFAAWSRRPYSSFSPAKARSYPDQVVDNWPQAFMVEHELTFAERLARA